MAHHPQRKRLRLKGYDYRTPGAYFVTICTQHQLQLFGSVVDGVVHLNDAGRMVWETWYELAEQFPSVRLDEFIVMPNHIHFILWLTTTARRSDPDSEGEDVLIPVDEAERPSLIDTMQWFKSFTTAKYRHGVHDEGWRPYPGKLWLRSYHDRIVRRDGGLNKIRRYIRNNPRRWSLDRFHPEPEGADLWAAEIWRMLHAEEEDRQAWNSPFDESTPANS